MGRTKTNSDHMYINLVAGHAYKQGKSLADVARDMGMEPATFYMQLRRGLHNIRIDTVIRAEKALGMEPLSLAQEIVDAAKGGAA